MHVLGKRTVRAGITVGLSLAAIVGLVGCAEQAAGDQTDELAAVQSENGLSMNGLSMNGLSMNGLSMNGLSMNGLSMNGLSMNGLAGVNGLQAVNGMMTTDGGRQIVQYLVKCAFPFGHNLIKRDQNNVTYTFPGAIGIAPEAEAGPCDLNCQEKISACMLAHVNNKGDHIGIWLDGSDSAIGWGSSPDFPYQEGAFFGNLIVNPWRGYFCAGKHMSQGEVPGRLGQPLTSTVYTDPYGSQGAGGVFCNFAGQNNCTITNEGYTNCNDPNPTAPYASGHKWGHVITVWRNFESTQMYKICNASTGKCLGVVGGSTGEGASIEHRTYSGAPGQTWQILSVGSGKYKVVNVNSGKVLDTTGAPVQKTYASAAAQQFPIAYRSDQPGFANLVPSSNTGSGLVPVTPTDGSLVQMSSTLTGGLTPDTAKWTFSAVGLAPATSGGTGGSNPCAAYCTNPTVFTSASFNSGNLGTAAVCRETTANLSGGGRYNMAGRTFSINGVGMGSSDGGFTLPPKVNGGYCIQATAGGLDYASFNSW